MHYPLTQYKSNSSGITKGFLGLNRTENSRLGEWIDCGNLDLQSYPCIAPRRKHGESLPLSLDGSVRGKICCSAEPIKDSGEYSGFTGVLIYDNCVGAAGEVIKNFVFLYSGKIIHVGQEPQEEGDTVPERTALWVYNAGSDSVTEEEITEFNSSLDRIIWTVAAAGPRYVINGYDPVLNRGKYFVYNTKKLCDSSSSKPTELERTVVPSDAQAAYSDIEFTNETRNGETLCVMINRDKDNKLSDRFCEGDYLWIKGSRWNDTNPYGEYGTLKKYAVVKEFEEFSMNDGSSYRENMYYYVAYPDGKLASNTKLTYQTVTLGVFVPPMKHIAVFGRRIWGVNPEEDSVYASVFDTPFKLINTDAQLDNSMSWQTVIGTADTGEGVVGAASEVLVMKRNSLIRMNGTSASTFAMTGIFNNCGCIDIKSCAEAAGTVYYLGRNGFYAYDGSQPKIISNKLNCSYSSAVGYSDGVKYYASAIRADNNEHEFLVYNISRGIWLKWSDTPPVKDFFRVGGSVFAAYNEDEGYVVELCGGNEAQEWFCESVNHYEDSNRFKGVNELWIRGDIKENVKVYTSVNGGEMKEHKELAPKGRMYMYKIPVRLSPGDFWRYRLEGRGECVIANIERVYEEGGARYYAD